MEHNPDESSWFWTLLYRAFVEKSRLLQYPTVANAIWRLGTMLKKVDAWTVACHPQCWKASPWCVHSSVATHFICITSPQGSSPGWCCLIGINVSLLSFLIDRLVTSIYKSTYTGCFENLPLQAEEWERAAPASEPAAFRSPHPLSSSKIITAASQQKWQLPTPHQVRKQLQPASARKVRGKLKTCARFRTNSMNRCKQEFLL